MRIDDRTYEITVSQYDYGIPIVFEADEGSGFQIGDEIKFVFDSNTLEDKTFFVSEIPYNFNFVLTKDEADNLWHRDITGRISIRYSIKRYRNNEFLESLENINEETVFRIIVKGTVKLDGKTKST